MVPGFARPNQHQKKYPRIKRMLLNGDTYDNDDDGDEDDD
jgi:hypothetical protein